MEDKAHLLTHRKIKQSNKSLDCTCSHSRRHWCRYYVETCECTDMAL